MINHKTRLSIWAILGYIILIALIAESVSAAPWEYYSDPWPRVESETIYLHTTGNCSYSNFALIKIAFESWGRVEVELVNDPLNSFMEYDQMFTLDCQSSQLMALKRAEKLPEGIKDKISDVTAGQAHTYWSTTTGEIKDCDTTLFEDQLTILNSRRVMRHETGHCLGLPHSTDNNSLMAPSPIVSTQQIEDMARISVLYGDCDVVIDEYGTAFIARAKRFGEEEVFQGFIRAGDVWPDDAYDVELAMCEL